MQRKPTANTRGPNAEEKRYMAWVKESNHCSACQKNKPVIAHHCEGSCFKHNKILIGHWFVIGLCLDCDSIITHGSRRKFREIFDNQSALWALSMNGYFNDTGYNAPQEVWDAILDWGK